MQYYETGGCFTAGFTAMELSRNVQSENTQNLGWADIMQRDERAAWKFLVPQVGKGTYT